MSDDNTTPTSIAWVRQHVDQRIMGLCGIVGAETGRNEKKLRQEMKDHISQEIRFLLKFIEGQAKTIDGLVQRVNAFERVLGKGSTATTDSRRRK